MRLIVAVSGDPGSSRSTKIAWSSMVEDRTRVNTSGILHCAALAVFPTLAVSMPSPKTCNCWVVWPGVYFLAEEARFPGSQGLLVHTSSRLAGHRRRLSMCPRETSMCRFRPTQEVWVYHLALRWLDHPYVLQRRSESRASRWAWPLSHNSQSLMHTTG